MDFYLESIQQQFQYYKLLGEKAISQLDHSELVKQTGENSNSIAVIVMHLSGNMLSRWTDFLTTDGEKPWRNRDREFTAVPISKDEILQKWKEGWDCFFNAVASLQTADLSTIIYIRKEGHTVLEAINRQLAHYAYHIGQIVFVAKQLKGTDFKNLSIPQDSSQLYNQEKFSCEKSIKNFTSEEIKRLKQ